MKTKYEIDSSFRNILKNIDNVSFSNQFDIDRIITVICDLQLDGFFDRLKSIQEYFDSVNDIIFDFLSLDVMKKNEFQKIFMFGELNAISKMILKLNMAHEKSVSILKDNMNVFLKLIICAIGNGQALTHNELAKSIGSNPPALTMRMKRDASWRKYITSYVNPKKQNGIIYVLNRNGSIMYENIIRESAKTSFNQNVVKWEIYNAQGGNYYEKPDINPISEFGQIGEKW